MNLNDEALSGIKNLLYTTQFSTVLGDMLACASDKGLCLLEFMDRRIPESECRDLSKRANAIVVSESNEHIERAIKEIQSYLSGELKEFTVQTHRFGTEFQQSVWEVLKTIPYGETLSYKQQAKRLGRPKAVRAVANANGMNRIAIIIPCHRVIGSDGSLTGYGGGLKRKKWLLDLEISHSPDTPIQ